MNGGEKKAPSDKEAVSRKIPVLSSIRRPSWEESSGFVWRTLRHVTVSVEKYI